MHARRCNDGPGQRGTRQEGNSALPQKRGFGVRYPVLDFFDVNKGKSNVSEKDSHGLNYYQAKLSDGSRNYNHL